MVVEDYVLNLDVIGSPKAELINVQDMEVEDDVLKSNAIKVQ